MKLKGEKEILLEGVYNQVETELFDYIETFLDTMTEESKKLKEFDASDDAERQRINISETLENINEINNKITVCRLVAQVILSGDFSLDEARALSKIINGTGYSDICNIVYDNIFNKVVNTSVIEDELHSMLRFEAYKEKCNNRNI